MLVPFFLIALMWKIASAQHSFRFLSSRALFVFVRNGYSTVGVTMAAQAEPSISKDILLKMRRETGYSYAKCRKALLACGGEQNYEQALQWIKKAAIEEGWDKAAKLSSRKASQGLIGFASLSDNVAIFVELNCETDFVARSEEFKKLVAELVNALRNQISDIFPMIGGAQKLTLKNVELAKIRLMDGRTAEEKIVATVGKMGENLQLARACVISCPNSNKLFGQTHPKGEFDDVHLGRFVSLVSLGTSEECASGFPTEQLGQQICQHIIGMAPESLGEPGKKAAKRTPIQTETVDTVETKEEQKTNATNESDAGEEEDLNASQVDQSELTRMNENETQLLHQPFMLNPEQTVGEYLEHHGAKIADFMRIEMGQENVSTHSEAAESLPAVPEEKDERTLRIERMADKILNERQLRVERRAQGIMYDEEVLEGRVVKFNYAGEFCEQRGIGEIHRQLRHYMIGCALVGAVTFAFVKFDLKKRRRRKMLERQMQLYEARKEALKKQKQLQLAT